MSEKTINKQLIKEAEEHLLKIAAADPVTWASVAKYLGQALGKAALGEVFKSLFKKGLDYKDLIRNLLKDVDSIITQRIAQAFINQSVAKMGAVQDAVEDYLNRSSKERLEAIENGSRELINEFASYKHSCYKEYLLTVPLRVFALEEYLKKGRRNEKKNILRVLNEAIDHLRLLDSQWRSISDARFKLKSDSSYLSFPDPMGGTYSYFVGSYWVEKNGKRVSQVRAWSDLERNSQRNAENAAKSDLVQQKNSGYQIDVVDEYIDPASTAIIEWEKRIEELSK